MTNEEIQALQAMEKRATKGPWKTQLVDSTCVVSPNGDDVCTTCDSLQAEREDGYNIHYERMEADAKFIAACREAVPTLCADLLAARAEVARLREALGPFAVHATTYGPYAQDERRILIGITPAAVDRATLTVGDFRRARAALEDWQ